MMMILQLNVTHFTSTHSFYDGLSGELVSIKLRDNRHCHTHLRINNRIFIEEAGDELYLIWQQEMTFVTLQK